MSGRLSVHNIHLRPGLTRSRSSTSPNTATQDESASSNARPNRPSHVRSRSYVTPASPKPTAASAFPDIHDDKPNEASRFSRLHLPGRHHDKNGTNEDARPVPQGQQSRHRYTQSEAQQYHRRPHIPIPSDSPGTPTIFTSSASSAEPPRDQVYPSSRRAAAPSLTRMASTRSYRAMPMGDAALYHGSGFDPTPGLRRRATSDPRSPTLDSGHEQLRPAQKSPIAIELEKADYLRRIARENVTDEDIEHMDQQLKEGAHELQERLANTNRSVSGLMYRLDDAEDSLLRTTESLVDTVSSFRNLSDQSLKLIENFEHESRHLDSDTRRRIKRYRDEVCNKKARRVERLEKRSQAMSKKATELSQRLKNCEKKVKDWRDREDNKRKAWRGVWVGVLWGLALIAIAVLAGIASWKAIEVHSGHGTAEEHLKHITIHNKSFSVDVLKDLEIPEDVKEVLIDIDERARHGRSTSSASPIAIDISTEDTKSSAKDDRSFRLLDEL